MRKTLLFGLVIMCMLMPQLGYSQDAKTVLAGVTKAMGDPKSLQYTGSGTLWALGQSASPDAPWPRFNIKSYTRAVNYDTLSMRDEVVRTQGEIRPVAAVYSPSLASSVRSCWSAAPRPGTRLGRMPSLPQRPPPSACSNSGSRHTVS